MHLNRHVCIGQRLLVKVQPSSMGQAFHQIDESKWMSPFSCSWNMVLKFLVGKISYL